MMDADVFWNGRLIGHLRNVVIDQPYYLGDWTSIQDPEFEQAFRSIQASIGEKGRGMIPVLFEASDSDLSAPARLMVRPAPESAPYFRFGLPDDVAQPV
jgi:hypothetical protein